MGSPTPNRRDFLQVGAAGLAAAGISPQSIGSIVRNAEGVPLRRFGRTPEMVSAICLGGHSATNPQKLSESESLRLIQRAIDEGITFLDNCWDYHDGEAEIRMGKAIASENRRDKVFLMTKVCGRTAKDARQHLEDSLTRLQTDRIDLWQFHEIVYDNDPDWIFAGDGAIEVGLEALNAGKVRYLGFTGHKDPAIHLKMLEKPHEWDAVLMPLNVMDASFRSFQHQVLPKLNERGIAALGMKSLGGNGSIVTKAGLSPADAIQYVLSLPITSLVSGIDSEAILDQNLEIVRSFVPMDEAARRKLEQSTLTVASDGRFELFKTSKQFDGPVHQKQHGFDAVSS